MFLLSWYRWKSYTYALNVIKARRSLLQRLLINSVIYRIINKSCPLRFCPITMSVALIYVTVAEMLISLQQQNSTFAL